MLLNNQDIQFLNQKFKNENPQFILEYSVNKLFNKQIAYVCSFGTESAIILHLISEINKNLPIIMINTHFLFEETLEYKKNIIQKLGLKNCSEIFPEPSEINIQDKNNELWKSDVDKCCDLRKVRPLEKSLKIYDAWISGRKSYHKGKRENLKPFEKINKKIVVNPLFNSDKDFIESYFLDNQLPKHPLFQKGYLSIGCTNCTVKTKISDDPRSGRWSSKIKTECGIHISKRS